MSYLGDFDLGTTLYTKFTTVNASGVPTELSAPAVAFFQDANTTAFVSGGISCDASWNSTPGLNHVQMIVTTSSTGIASGSQYQIALTTGTVSGVNLKGYVIGEFSIHKRSALMPATAGRTVVIDANGLVQANVTAISTIAPANVTAASINIGAIVTTCNTIVPANVTAASINIGAVVTAVNTITPARVTAQGIDIGAIVTAINTIADANVTSISTVVPANVTSFSASGIGTLYVVSPGITYASASTTSLLRALVTGVWDEPGANHTTIGSLGQELNSAGTAADPWATVLPGAYVTSEAGNILGSRVDVSVGSRLAAGATVASVSVLGTVAGVSVLGTVAGVSVLGTVASVSTLGTVSANIIQVASVSVTGFGTVASPWGP